MRKLLPAKSKEGGQSWTHTCIQRLKTTHYIFTPSHESQRERESERDVGGLIHYSFMCKLKKKDMTVYSEQLKGRMQAQRNETPLKRRRAPALNPPI